MDAPVETACADCLDYLAGLPAGSAQLVLTSPPYNVGKAYEAKSTMADYLTGQARVIAEAVRITGDSGSLCWQVGNHVSNGAVLPLDIALHPLFAEHGLQLRNRIMWHFGHGLHCRKRFSGRHETILWFTKSDDYVFNLDPVRVPAKYPGKKHFKGPRKGEISGNPLGKNPTDVWDIPNVKHNHPEKTAHPCSFPVQLAERLVLALTDAGGLVVDPYMGAGSTAVAAALHGRAFQGCDRDPAYAAIAGERIEQLRRGELKLHRDVKGKSAGNSALFAKAP